MTRPLLELADIIRAAGQRLIDRHPAWLTWLHVKVLVAIERCRPLLELADIIRAAGQRLIDRHPAWLTWLHVKVLVAIDRCRTAALGGHVDECSRCGHRAISYNSCRNRHCPQCQSNARDRWLHARRSELLATPYTHVVFTLPHELAPLALQNKEVMYS